MPAALPAPAPDAKLKLFNSDLSSPERLQRSMRLGADISPEVAARVLDVRRRVDDPADRLRRELADRGQQRLARRGGARVDHEHAFVADLHGDVRARAREQPHVALHVQRLDARLRVRSRSGADSSWKSLALIFPILWSNSSSLMVRSVLAFS